MYRISEGNPLDLADVAQFIDLINEPPRGLEAFFDENKDIIVTRAPGRLDIMGGIADYSGSLVLEMPIAEATLAAIQKSDDRMIKIASFHVSSSRHSAYEMKLADLETHGRPREYADVRDFFDRNRHFHWASYAAGV